MAERKQQELQAGVEAMLDRLDRGHFRPLHKKAYLCMAACYDSRGSQDAIGACADKCGQPIQGVQQVVGNEMNDLQSRVQRCAQSCADDARWVMVIVGPGSYGGLRLMGPLTTMRVFRCSLLCACARQGQNAGWRTTNGS